MKKHKGKPESSAAKMDRDVLRGHLKSLNVKETDELSGVLLRQVVTGSARPGEDLAWLMAYDMDPEVSGAAFLALFYALESEDLPEPLVEQVQGAAGPVLLKALQNPNVPDARKYRLLPLYTMCGEDLPEQDIRSFFKDWEGAQQQALSTVAQSCSEDPEQLEHLLAGTLLDEDEDSPMDARLKGILGLAAHVPPDRPAVASMLVAVSLVAGWDPELDDALIDGAVQLMHDTACPEAAWLLREMGRWPGIGGLQDRVRRAATKMQLSGIVPDYRSVTRFSHGLLSSPDGSGTRQMTLFFLTNEGTLDALMLLINDTVGLKDAVCVYGEGAELEADLRDSPMGAGLAPCPLALGREILADLWAFHEETGNPFPPFMLLYRTFLGPEPIEPRRRIPNLSVYKLDTLASTPDLAEDSGRLMDADAFSMLMFLSDAAYEFVERVNPKYKAHLSTRHIDQFIEEVGNLDKVTLLSRMALCLETEALAGRAAEETNQIAARTWLALSKNVLPLAQAPYIRRLARHSTDLITENFKMGFHNQAEVNEALDAFEDEDFDEDLEDRDKNIF